MLWALSSPPLIIATSTLGILNYCLCCNSDFPNGMISAKKRHIKYYTYFPCIMQLLLFICHQVTTINGARVTPNKRDIEIPQGIAHAIDRVMFPLPVGDLVQTMQADRERRFSTFLRLLHVSGLEETLTGNTALYILYITHWESEIDIYAGCSPMFVWMCVCFFL